MFQDGASALHVACQNGHVETVRELLKAKAPIDQQTKVPVYIAIMHVQYIHTCVVCIYNALQNCQAQDVASVAACKNICYFSKLSYLGACNMGTSMQCTPVRVVCALGFGVIKTCIITLCALGTYVALVLCTCHKYLTWTKLPMYYIMCIKKYCGHIQSPHNIMHLKLQW